METASWGIGHSRHLWKDRGRRGMGQEVLGVACNRCERDVKDEALRGHEELINAE